MRGQEGRLRGRKESGWRVKGREEGWKGREQVRVKKEEKGKDRGEKEER